jgi:hypothetical protein
MLPVLVLNLKSRAPKIYDSSKRGPLDVKWRELDSTLLQLRAQIRNAVLADRGVLQADCHRENCHTADCYSQRSEFESGMPQA